MNDLPGKSSGRWASSPSRKTAESVDVTICVATDGFFSAYCSEYPALFGQGDTMEEAVEELHETLRQTRRLGRESAAFYPEWLDHEYELCLHWDVRSVLQYYAGIITPTALGRLSGIHPKQMWAYMHGLSKPRPAQVSRISDALHKLGRELSDIAF